MQSYYSHGKLLLTGEYVILDGAIGLAIPTQKGQSLTVEIIDEPKVQWKSIDSDGAIWFEDVFLIVDIVSSSQISEAKNTISSNLLQILRTAHELNPNFLTIEQGYKVISTLEFPRDWGLGSSSTLINNIANWAEVDVFSLLARSFGGSGYDVACADRPTPILYQLKQDNPIIQSVDYAPKFSNHLFFVHLNKKQDSRKGIAHYKANRTHLDQAISKISAITKLIFNCDALVTFEGLLQRHEQIISELLDLPTVRSSLFSDYEGAIKSLGAWGGDFVLVTAKKDPTDYFAKKGYKTVIPFDNMVLKQKDLT